MSEHPKKEDTFRLLRVLASEDRLDQRGLSERLGFSLGKVNYLLNSLAKKGFIKMRNFSRGDRKIKKIQYLLTEKGFIEKRDLTFYFLKEKEREYLQLKREAESQARAEG